MSNISSLGQVDSWKKKVYSYKGSDKKKQKYCLHTIRIGNSQYNFVERMVPGYGVVINPDYKVSDDLPNVGGVVKQHGELLFWDYFFEGSGWQRVRPLTNNELICLDFIQEHGYFTSSEK